mgnify:CR=1 FL=1
MRDWVTNIEDTYYIIGSVTGPHPYPMIVRDFNAIVGRELKVQSMELFSQYPDAILACVLLKFFLIIYFNNVSKMMYYHWPTQ